MLRSYCQALLALVVALSLTDISFARTPKTSLKLLGQWSPPKTAPGPEQVWPALFFSSRMHLLLCSKLESQTAQLQVCLQCIISNCQAGLVLQCASAQHCPC
jgi:hypothetical protein